MHRALIGLLGMPIGNDERPAIGMAHHAMASADTHDREISPLKRPDHRHPRNGREGSPASRIGRTELQ